MYIHAHVRSCTSMFTHGQCHLHLISFRCTRTVILDGSVYHHPVLNFFHCRVPSLGSVKKIHHRLYRDPHTRWIRITSSGFIISSQYSTFAGIRKKNSSSIVSGPAYGTNLHTTIRFYLSLHSLCLNFKYIWMNDYWIRNLRDGSETTFNFLFENMWSRCMWSGSEFADVGTANFVFSPLYPTQQIFFLTPLNANLLISRRACPPNANLLTN